MTEHIDVSTLRRQAFFWLAALLAFAVFLFVFRSILLPFLAGFALAYFLDPVADFLQRRKLSRLAATVLILVTFVLLFVASLVVIVPVLVTQFSAFMRDLPDYYENLRGLLTRLVASTPWLSDFVNGEANRLGGSLNDIVQQGAGFAASLIQGIWSSASAAINIVGLLVVTPVVAFYMLLDWDKMVARIDSWIPRAHVETVRQLGREVNQAIAGFVRGQGTVCLLLALFYATALSVVGLNFGLLIGLVAGLISFIPYVGSLVGLVLSVGVALVQYWPDAAMVAEAGYLPSLVSIGIVAAIFFVGQLVEGNFLQPKLVGDSVGLHPVWLMFALFAFGSLFGFTGMLVAVPASAAIGVLVRFALARYLDSDLYEDGNGSRR